MRIGWIDALRGFAMIVVVFSHALGVAWRLADPGVPGIVGDISLFFLPFRMPTLMVLSGWMLSRSLARGAVRYADGKVRSLVWPYLVWILVYWVVSSDEAWRSPTGWLAASWLWFIFYLAIYYAVAPLLVRLPALAVPLLLWAASVLAPGGGWTNLLLYGGFFFAGHAAWVHRARLRRIDRPWVLVSVALVAILFGIGVVLGPASPLVPFEYRVDWVLLIPFTLCGIAAFVLAARRIPDRRTGALRFIGRNSVVVYVVHYPLQLALADWMQDEGVTDWRLILLAAFALPMLVSVGLAFARRFAAVDALFVMPRVLPRRSPGTSSATPA